MILIAAAATLFPTWAPAEYMTAPGDIAKQTDQASAQLNEALSHFHLMMAAVDLKNSETALKQQQAFFIGLASAAESYRSTSGKAAERPLSPKPANPGDIECIALFNTQAEAFGLKLHASQHDLILKAADLLSQLLKELDADGMINKMIGNIPLQQSVTTQVSKITNFLNCATTVIRTGG